MRALPSAPLRAKRRGWACRECRIRKQKCERRQGAPCNHCSRRYPPVECIFKSGPILSNPSGAVPSQIGQASIVTPSPRTCLVPISSLVTNSSEVIAHGAGLEQNYWPIPLSEEEKARSPFPPKRMDVLHHLHRIASPMPFGIASFGGAILADTGLGGLPAERVAQLLHFFHYFVVPNRCSVDGSDVPTFFMAEILPMMIPNMAVLMASSAQSAEPGFEISNPSEQFALKANALSLINNLIKQGAVVARAALPAVLHLILVEWYWGNSANVWAHLDGAKQIIQVQGGFEGLDYLRLQQGLTLLDWEIACACERDLYLQDSHAANEGDIFILSKYPTALRSPLLPYPNTFRHDINPLKLSPLAAEILDCIQLLINSITSTASSRTSIEVQTLAASLQSLAETKLPDDFTPNTTVSSTITSIILITAQIYGQSIFTLTPLSQIWTPALLEPFYNQVSSISLNTWQQIPGIFLWVLLVACPGTRDDVVGKWIKRKMAVSGMAIALEDFGLAIGYFRAFWRVQRWIKK
ncbi:hypothetical protein N431DRAFT_354741 [Stipitochalara longipes BDJ]|nr:hypothetical protein N431DRAFT_354741 [Stipitochalara longipes BDJ]